MKKTILVLALGLLIGCAEKTSEEHIQAAQEHIAQDNMDAAVLELKNAIQIDPNSAQARFDLGSLYLQQQQFESAEKELNRALDNGYSPEKVIPLLSKAYKRTGAYAALSTIDHAQAGMSDVEKAEVSFFKLQSLVQLDKKDEVNELLAEIRALDTKSVYRKLSLVYAPITAGDFDGALRELEAAREQAPGNADVLKLQGQLLLQLKKAEEAIAVYRNYNRLFPEDRQITFVLAGLMVNSGQTIEAEPYVDELLGISADNALLNQLKATILAAKNDSGNAQIFAEKSITGGRADPVVRLIAGFSAYKNGDFEAATRHLSYIASSLPDNHPGLKILAASQLETGQSSEASDVLGRIEQLTENDAALFSKAGYELIRAGNFKEAKEVVERSSYISRGAEDLARLGVLKLSLNDVQGIVNLEEAVQQAPELVSAKSTLATAYLISEQLDKAVELAKDWKQSFPEDPKAYMLAGEVLMKQNQFAAAKVEYQQALSLDKGNTLAKLALANIEFRQGNSQAGEAMLSEALKSDPSSIAALTTFYSVERAKSTHEEAMAPALAALASNSDNVELAVAVARMYLTEQDWDNASTVLESFPVTENSPATFLQVKGQTLLRANKIALAEQHYDVWMEKHPSAKSAILGKLLLLDLQNRFEEGTALSQAFLDKRDDPQILLLNTHFKVLNGEFEAARKAYDAMPEELKTLPFVDGFMARLLLAENKPQEALAPAESAYEQNPNSRNLLVLVGTMELIGERDASMSLLKKHVADKPTDQTAKMLLAERQIPNSYADAIATYEDSLSLNPDNFVVLNNLAYLYMQEGRLEEAKTHATKAVEIQPDNAAAVDTLAQVFVALKEYDQALTFYDRIVNNEIRNEEIFLNYIETLLVAEKPRVAQRRLERRGELESDASKKRVAELKVKYGI